MPISTFPSKPEPPPYDIARSMAWYKHTRSDTWWQSQMPINPLFLLAVCGSVNRREANALRDYKTAPSNAIMKKIGFLIPKIESRELVFPHVPVGAPRKNEYRAPQYLFIDAPLSTRCISRLSPGSAWALHARCITCRGNKFLPIEIDGKPHVACYQCLPPSQYKSIGATAVDKSLIHEALKVFY